MNKRFHFTDENIERLFGHEAAEREEPSRLVEYFLRNDNYSAIRSHLPLKIAVGFKGVGKSALLKVAYEEDIQKEVPAIWIRPDDVSELYDELLNKDNFLHLVTLWKKGLSRLIACRLSESWTFTARGDTENALTWAEEAGYRSKDLITQLAQRFKQSHIHTDRKSNSVLGEHHVVERLLKQKKINIYIDDLDRGWEASQREARSLSALLNALGDLTSTIDGLSARLSLREDVYNLIRKNDQTGDKFDGNIVNCHWENSAILIALAKRIQTFFGNKVDDFRIQQLHHAHLVKYLKPVFEPEFKNTLCWNGSSIHKVFMALMRGRPRDIVKLCTLAAKKARENERSIITGKDIESVLYDYSKKRLDDLAIEFKFEMTELGKLLYKMGPTTDEIKTKDRNRYTYTTEELMKKIGAVLAN